MKPLLYACLALTISLCVFSSCDTEMDFVTGDSVNLRFSADTIMFDTVFTDVGSATRIIKVYNDASDPVKIDRIMVEGSTGVVYTFNADGYSGPIARNVPIFAGDSIYVFVEVEVDPTAPEEISPFIAEDRLIFEMGNVREDVVLTAFGQNALYINGFDRGTFLPISCEGGTAAFPTDLPVVIYGSLFIDSCVVQALPGTRIYFHGGIQRNQDFFPGNGYFNDGFIYTLPTGSLQLLGTLEDPVILRTDRLEDRFEKQPAMYRGLILGPGSRDNIIRHAKLYNAIAGVSLDSAAELSIENSEIAYTGGPAVTSRLARLKVKNSIFHSNFGNSLQVILGGRVDLDHVTLANYGVDARALVLTNFECDEDDNCFVSPLRLNMRNSIIQGSQTSELVFGDATAGTELGYFEIAINNSVVRVDNEFLEAEDGLYRDFLTSLCSNCINSNYQDAMFRSVPQDDYRLDSLSAARNLAVFDPNLPNDIRGAQRQPDSTDAGAYEFVPGEE